MAEETAATPESAAPAAPAPEPVPPVAEAVSTPTPPAASATPEPVPAVVPEAPAPETPAAPAAPESASLLSEAATPAPEPAAEAKAEDKSASEAPAEEARPEEAPLPEYDVFTVPEGVELEDQQVEQFVGILGTAERAILAAAGDPAKIRAAVQQFGQQALDQYTAEIQQLGGRIAEINAETFRNTQEYWKSQFFEDPEIGGNRKDTTLKNCGAVISRFGGSPQQIAEVRSVLTNTGAGNNVALIRLFNNVANFLGEPQPVAGTKPDPQPQSRQDKRYGNRK